MSVMKLDNQKEAFALLDRAAAQVQPIMSKHKWTVAKLVEFYPKNAGLLGLNVNKGAQVKVRLRRGGDKNSFLPYNDVLGTLLHELCHNTHGNH